MKKEELIKSAEKLKQPSAEATEEFSKKADRMANILNEQFGRRTDLAQLIGEGNLEMMHGNHRNHLRFMISIFSIYNSEAFTESVLWVFRAYRSHGFQLTYWPAQLDNWVEIFKNELSPESYEQIYPFYHWMIVNNPVFANISNQDICDHQKPSTKNS